ncbi:MAG TPA: site-2 protease family protein [Thermoanaerobaculia bacterium]|nr:site-2 protease family protein [Thermoanaerobaculia bacterium]
MAQILGSNVLGFVIGLGFLIFVHELGHFGVAKLFRVRVLVFSFGFGKRLFGFKRGDTDYRVSLIPLGGYVRMAGDNPEENQTGNPDEFLSKPKWQRFLILFAGPAMNILIAIAVFAVMYMIGVPQAPLKPILGEVVRGKAADKAGLKPFDRIVRIEDEAINDWDDFRLMVSMNAGTTLDVEYVRDGKTQTTKLTPVHENSDYGPVGKAGAAPFVDTKVVSVEPGSAATKAGIKVGDRVVGANGKPVTQLFDLEGVFEKSRTKPIVLEIERAGAKVPITLAPPGKNPPDTYPGFSFVPVTIQKLPFIPAIGESVRQNWKMLKLAVFSLRRMFRSEGSVKELSGPISIARISGEMLRRSLRDFIGLVALISLQLGVMNLLPIPVLDGGHIMILLIEGVARRDLSLRVKERIQQLGFAVLAMLMIVVLYNDVIAQVFRTKGG